MEVWPMVVVWPMVALRQVRADGLGLHRRLE
jgi:hypothetical protein